jgi:hypothetical protein
MQPATGSLNYAFMGQQQGNDHAGPGVITDDDDDDDGGDHNLRMQALPCRQHNVGLDHEQRKCPAGMNMNNV